MSGAPNPENRGRKKAAAWLVGLSLVATCAALFVVLGQKNPSLSSRPPAEPTARVVSLSPGVTDTIEALGRSQMLVAISDYCVWDSPEETPTRVGSAITPNYEKIVETQPTLILTSEARGAPTQPLERLATTVALPWLTPKQWSHSVVELGRLIGAEKEAHALSARIDETLGHQSTPEGPRILLALDYGDSGTSDVWFIRRNSIHGALLEAAGAKNAVDRDIEGQPKLSSEQLIALDPEGIVILLSTTDQQAAQRSVNHFRRLEVLSATRNDTIFPLLAPGSLNVGPHLLDLIGPLRALVDKTVESGR